MGKKAQHGLTLVEMMLAIVVIAIMGLYGINIAREQSRAARVDESVAQMRLIMRAATQYHASTGKWPISREALATAAGVPNELSIFCSPWDGVGIPSVCSKRALYTFPTTATAATAKRFELSVVAPKEIAPLLAGKLPTATFTGTNVTAYVFAALLPPQTPDRGYVWSGGVGRGTATIEMPICPEGYVGKYVPAPTFVATDHRVTGIWPFTDENTWGIQLSSELLVNGSRGGLNSNAYVVTKFHAREESGDHLPGSGDPFDYFAWMTFCIPTDKWTE